MRALACIALVSIPCTAVAQTTWTSFADRRGHMMAATPSQGVVMFGGESVTSPGTLLGDTHELSTNNQTWTQGGEDGPSAPAPTSHGSMAATTIAGQATYVMFGGTVMVGSSPVPSARTYRYDGTAWGDHTNGTHPSARAKHVMVTNPVTNTMFLFGGYDGAQALDDMWEFTPQTDSWVVRNPGGNGPTTRFGHAMAFHPHGGGTNGRIYVFGGSSFDDETLEYNPNTNAWTQLFPSVSPPGRYLASMAYVAVGARIVLFGGLGLGPGGATVLGDTWAFTRSGPTGTPVWTQVSSAISPPPRYEHNLTTGSSGNDVVLLGGTNALPVNTASTVLEETWTYSLLGGWVRTVPAPSPRDGAAMAYDSVRNRHVVFGGRTVPGGVDLDETWELDGLNWRSRSPTTRPSARSDAAAVFDPVRNVTVVYGGRLAGGQELSDTWEWNGSVWTPRTLASNPPAAGGAQPVFDSLRGKVKMLVGSNLWTYDGVAWAAPASIPGRTQFSAAYDRSRSRLVVFGGNTQATAIDAETWEWDGTAWTHMSPAAAPQGRRDCAMTYDAARQACVMVGGWNNFNLLGDVWTWNGTNWAQTASVGPRIGCALNYDAARARTVLFGGNDGSLLADLLEWNGATWTNVTIATPSPRFSSSCAFDPLRSVIVLFGGFEANTYGVVDQTWEYDGLAWTQRIVPTRPSPRRDAAMSFDAIGGKVLLFGGRDAAGELGDTWAWDGSAWSQLSPAISPSPRSYAVLVDTGTRPLLFGGQFGPTPTLPTEVWQWTGVTWLNLGPFSPSFRTNYGSAYDARRDRVVVFGGMTSNNRASATYNAETWEWNGSAWQQRFPMTSPPARGWCRLAYDERRSRTILFGGADATNTFQDTWEWDGSGWAQRSPGTNPPGSFGHDMTFDAARGLAIAYGSFGTWDYGAVNPGTALPPAQSRPGCPTSVSLGQNFTLKPLPWTGPWAGDPIEMEFEHAPPGLGMFVWGFSDWGLAPSIPLFVFNSPNCFLHENADILEVLPLSATRYTSSFAIPNVPAAVGFKLYGQGAWFDLGAPVFPTIVTTNELVFTVGSK